MTFRVSTALQQTRHTILSLSTSIHTDRMNPQKVAFPARSFSNNLSRGNIVYFKGKREGVLGDVIQSKNRPFLIVSSDVVTQEFNKVMLTPLSTAPVRLSFEVELPANMQTGLSMPSKVMTNQVFTVPKTERTIEKIGSAVEHLPKINQALKICFGNHKIPEKDLKELITARGDLVEIDVEGSVFEGVVVSNDMGNLYSRIAMAADATIPKTQNLETKLETIVQVEGTNSPRQLYVQCHTINTFAQSVMTKKGRIRELDMIRITKLLHIALGIDI